MINGQADGAKRAEDYDNVEMLKGSKEGDRAKIGRGRKDMLLFVLLFTSLWHFVRYAKFNSTIKHIK